MIEVDLLGICSSLSLHASRVPPVIMFPYFYLCVSRVLPVSLSLSSLPCFRVPHSLYQLSMVCPVCLLASSPDNSVFDLTYSNTNNRSPTYDFRSARTAAQSPQTFPTRCRSCTASPPSWSSRGSPPACTLTSPRPSRTRWSTTGMGNGKSEKCTSSCEILGGSATPRRVREISYVNARVKCFVLLGARHPQVEGREKGRMRMRVLLVHTMARALAVVCACAL